MHSPSLNVEELAFTIQYLLEGLAGWVSNKIPVVSRCQEWTHRVRRRVPAVIVSSSATAVPATWHGFKARLDVTWTPCPLWSRTVL